ncbi:small GTP-binding protein [Histomonas meleagridis]|uniref:small GTP-binding protein n=1 Tax=Histomonas meleagridis TaxID=135588 RepID=UPI00355A368F|nr:small GTP-binding protein [Histomonas meleagridis]KAH0796574.1 small GTP-binding protein [Histomonas meleagridis]
MEEITVKIAIFGSGAVGKSALSIQFIKGYFVETYDPTIEESFKRTVEINGRVVHFDILDTAGQDDFAPMRISYIRNREAFILVYAINNRASFDEIENYYQLIVQTKREEDETPLVLCGNKCDLEEQRYISTEDGMEMAKQIKADFFETSAVLNHNVTNAFFKVATRLMELQKMGTPNLGKPNVNDSKSFCCLKCNII